MFGVWYDTGIIADQLIIVDDVVLRVRYHTILVRKTRTGHTVFDNIIIKQTKPNFVHHNKELYTNPKSFVE